MAELSFESWEQDETLKAAPLDPSKLWYVLRESGQTGPLTLKELRAAVRSGDLPEDALLWQEGFKDWVAASTLPQLKALLDSVPPAPDEIGNDAITVHDVQSSLQQIALKFEAEHRSSVPPPPKVPEIDPRAVLVRAMQLRARLGVWRDRALALARDLERSPKWVWAALGAGGATLVQALAWLWWLAHHATP